jgi:hypothetical protein
MKSQSEAFNPVKLFSQARHAFRIPQRLTLSGMTRRGVASPEIVTFALYALFMGASSIAQMPGLIGGMVTMVSTSCIYLWLKDPRFDSRKLLRMPFLNCQGINFIDDTYCLNPHEWSFHPARSQHWTQEPGTCSCGSLSVDEKSLWLCGLCHFRFQ